MARKNTRITLLYSDNSRNSPWSLVNDMDIVDKTLEHARQEFGPSGTQAGRRWFYRIRDEVYFVTVGEVGSKWKNVPRVRYWCDIYFRDPKDATWFQLKKNLS